MNAHELEFDKQVENLILKHYPDAAGLNITEFRKLLEPLKEKVNELQPSERDIENGYLPFVIVIKSTLIPTEKAMSIVSKDGKNGITKLFPLQPDDFQILDSIEIPASDVYLLVDIDRGGEYRNIRPEDALKDITAKNRSALTIDEGIAILTHFPEFLIKNNCFSLLASRHPGDQRVPALWINGEKHPNLGWCWDRNPHTWLGSASCQKRVF